MTDKEDNKLMTPHEVAEQLGLHFNTVYGLIKDGTLVAKKYGGRYLIRAEDAGNIQIHRNPDAPGKPLILRQDVNPKEPNDGSEA